MSHSRITFLLPSSASLPETIKKEVSIFFQSLNKLELIPTFCWNYFIILLNFFRPTSLYKEKWFKKRNNFSTTKNLSRKNQYEKNMNYGKLYLLDQGCVLDEVKEDSNDTIDLVEVNKSWRQLLTVKNQPFTKLACWAKMDVISIFLSQILMLILILFI